MRELILVLIVISVGCSAYVSARRAGTWSWRLFALSVLGLLAIGLAGGFLSIWLMRRFGPDNALISTLAVVGVIAVGVSALAYWLRPNKKR